MSYIHICIAKCDVINACNGLMDCTESLPFFDTCGFMKSKCIS